MYVLMRNKVIKIYREKVMNHKKLKSHSVNIEILRGITILKVNFNMNEFTQETLRHKRMQDQTSLCLYVCMYV